MDAIAIVKWPDKDNSTVKSQCDNPTAVTGKKSLSVESSIILT